MGKDNQEISEELSDLPADPINYPIVTIVAFALFCDYLLLTLCVPILPEAFGDDFSPLLVGILFASK